MKLFSYIRELVSLELAIFQEVELSLQATAWGGMFSTYY